MVRPLLRPPLILVLVAALLGACSDGEPTARTTTSTALPKTTSTSPGPCGEPISEALDPNSGRHLLPGQPDPVYLTDPPTSGPHRSGDHPTGVLPDPIERPVQVAMIEVGQVIIQHKDIAKVDFDAITALATESVTVAPNPSLPGMIVATAWQVKLVCRSVDETALRAFISTYLDPEAGH